MCSVTTRRSRSSAAALSRPASYSQQTARDIDDEIRGLIERAYDAALQILHAHRAQLDVIARVLLERETLGRR